MENYEKDIARAIHYPECWDTATFPTLASALWEMVILEEGDKCSECREAQGLESTDKTGEDKRDGMEK